MSCSMVWWYNSVLQGLTWFVSCFHDYILSLVHDVWDDIVEMICWYIDGWDTWLRHLVHGRGISWVIWHLFEAYGWYTPLMISYGILYGIDVHGCCAWLAHSMAHDVHGWYFVHDSLFIVDIYFDSWCMVWHEFDAWTGPRIVIERGVDLCFD